MGSGFLLSMLNIIAYFTESMFKQTCFVLEHEQCIQFVPRKRQFSVWKIGIFYLEIFPIKMGLYVRLRCIYQSTIRREISIRHLVPCVYDGDISTVKRKVANNGQELVQSEPKSCP